MPERVQLVAYSLQRRGELAVAFERLATESAPLSSLNASRRSRAALSSALRGIRQRRINPWPRQSPFDPCIARELDQLRGRLTVCPKNRLAVSGNWCASSKVSCCEAGSSSDMPFVAQHDVGKKQMMIDDHHVRRQRLLARFHHEAFRIMRALGAEAVLARRGHVRPDARVLRHRRKIAFVAARGCCGEARYQRQVSASSRLAKRPSLCARSR